MTATIRTTFGRTHAGQVLVLFVLFLLVLLGISALAIDYASWLLVDRNLQNTADHAALAGAAEFSNRPAQGSCTGGPGQPQCERARAQAWTSINAELQLGLSPAAITQLSLADSPAGGTTTVTAGGTTFTWQDRVWVATPPPTYAAYTAQAIGGKYSQNYGVVFARVDHNVKSFIGGALGVTPQPRHGWATAGALPVGFALQTFCRIGLAPSSGACTSTHGLSIDGQGGIRLVRGDIGTNESLRVTANVGQGVQLLEGNMFLVNDVCQSSTWNCPNGPPSIGGISDGAPSYVGKNAFYMAPWSVPHFASPLDAAGISAWSCAGASASNLCVPYKDQNSGTPTAPGDWTCLTSGSVNRCGTPTVTSGRVTCVGQGGGLPPLHYYPTGPSLNNVNADPGHPQGNSTKYQNIDDSFENGDLDTAATPANPPIDYLYTDNIRLNGQPPWTRSFTVNLAPSGPRLPGISTVRFVAFKTNATSTPAGGLVSDGNNVTLQVSLLGSSGTILADPTIRTLTNVPTRYEFTVGAGVIPAAQFNSLRLQFTFFSTVGAPAAERGGGVSWAEIEHPEPQPALPPMIAPGYYRSIDIPAGSCAVLDPTAEYSSLQDWQMPGIYRFGGTGSNNQKKLKIGDGSYLVGDGVTLVFDPDWPASGSNQGVAIGANGALVLNTMRVLGSVPPCTPSEPADPQARNDSSPLSDLPYSAVCAAWGVDPTDVPGIRPGQNAWHACDPANPDAASHCVIRSTYSPVSNYRGITFYFTPDGNWTKPHQNITILNRFEMQGGSGNDAGLAFRGVLYAPYDDVKISGGNGFNTVGMVLAWTAKFNGGSAYIDLDYPYNPGEAAPYLLEPTVDH